MRVVMLFCHLSDISKMSAMVGESRVPTISWSWLGERKGLTKPYHRREEQPKAYEKEVWQLSRDEGPTSPAKPDGIRPCWPLTGRHRAGSRCFNLKDVAFEIDENGFVVSILLVISWAFIIFTFLPLTHDTVMVICVSKFANLPNSQRLYNDSYIFPFFVLRCSTIPVTMISHSDVISISN